MELFMPFSALFSTQIIMWVKVLCRFCLRFLRYLQMYLPHLLDDLSLSSPIFIVSYFASFMSFILDSWGPLTTYFDLPALAGFSPRALLAGNLRATRNESIRKAKYKYK